MHKETLLKVLENRFNENMHRHPDVLWKDIIRRLNNNTNNLNTILKMENLGGEPDLVVFKNGKYGYVDFCKESPIKRRGLCYDMAAFVRRKKYKPVGNAVSAANDIGIKLLSTDEYNYMQTLEPFDLKTSSWLETPKEIRTLGGAIFAERRYNKVFTFHNGADSYYASRGFRGIIII